MAMHLLQGPHLGPLFDALMSRMKPLAASNELLLLDTSNTDNEKASEAVNIIEPQDAATVIISLLENNGQAILIESPVLGVSIGLPNENSLRREFNDEFALIERNIRSLFQGINMGTVSAAQSQDYLWNLINLAERSKERLLGAVVRRDTAGELLFVRSSAAFEAVAGGVYQNGGREIYLDKIPDADGVIRRIKPLSYGLQTSRYGSYAMLRNAFAKKGDIETRPEGGHQYLIFSRAGQMIPLDSQGNIILERNNEDFKRLSLSDFQQASSGEAALTAALKQAETKGYFNELEPENYPTYLSDWANNLLEVFLSQPNPENLSRWKESRLNFFTAVDSLLKSDTEKNLLLQYEGESNPGELNNVHSIFASIKEEFKALQAGRTKIHNAVSGSFCVMGQPSEAEISLEAANAILLGRAICPASSFWLIIVIAASALLTTLILIRTEPGPCLILGLIWFFLVGLGFSISFILSSYWIDPLIPLSAVASALVLSFMLALINQIQANKVFHAYYGDAIPATYLDFLIKNSRPPRKNMVEYAKVAVIAVRNSQIEADEIALTAKNSMQHRAAFQKTICNAFHKAGASLVSYENDVILAVFGSPAERLYIKLSHQGSPYNDDLAARGNNSPAVKAVGCVLDIIQNLADAAKPLRFGLDIGECVFGSPDETGYGAFGQATACARILSNLASQYQAKVMLSETFAEKLDQNLTRRLDGKLHQNADEEEPFYELLVT
ncbi:MAG: hypothetical protein LBM77_00685 [Spirochaetaceae bacterium]|nr:hypothetical protein [Spirochaetaceae bacterium]